MTTIAYKDGVMAADSKTTEGGYFVTRAKKIHRLASGALLGQAGNVDIRDVIDLLDKTRTEKSLPTREALAKTRCDFRGILVLKNGGVYLIDITPVQFADTLADWDAQVIEVRERFTAVGSGEQFAIGAMAAGMNAEQAVSIACRYDGASGGPVNAVPLKKVGKEST